MTRKTMEGPIFGSLNKQERRLARAAVRRRRLFLAISLVGIAAASVLAAYYAFRRVQDPGYPIGVRAALVVLILLNARQNLRQYRYATVLEKLVVRRGG